MAQSRQLNKRVKHFDFSKRHKKSCYFFFFWKPSTESNRIIRLVAVISFTNSQRPIDCVSLLNLSKQFQFDMLDTFLSCQRKFLVNKRRVEKLQREKEKVPSQSFTLSRRLCCVGATWRLGRLMNSARTDDDISFDLKSSLFVLFSSRLGQTL